MQDSSWGVCGEALVILKHVASMSCLIVCNTSPSTSYSECQMKSPDSQISPENSVAFHTSSQLHVLPQPIWTRATCAFVRWCFSPSQFTAGVTQVVKAVSKQYKSVMQEVRFKAVQKTIGIEGRFKSIQKCDARGEFQTSTKEDWDGGPFHSSTKV